MMKINKRKNMIYNISIFVMLIALIALFIYKFVLLPKSRIDLKNFQQAAHITLEKPGGESVTFNELIANSKEVYILFFEIDNCSSCIFKGIEDLKSLKKNGKVCIAIAVHNWKDDIEGWSQSYDFEPIYVLSKTDFYDYISYNFLPVLIHLVDGEVKSQRNFTL